MSQISLARDANRIVVLGGTSNVDGTTVIAAYVDSTTHRLLVDSSGGGGVTAFTQLSDVPNSYVGQGGKAVRVNAGETALEFFSATGSGTVTSIIAGTGLTGGTIITTGTIALDLTRGNTWTGATIMTSGSAANFVPLTINQNDTTNNNKGLIINNSGTGTSLQITPTGNAAASISTGGAFNLTNTSNDGAGAVFFTAHAGSATGRLVEINASNAAFNQNALHVDYAGTANAVSIATTSTNSAGAALDLQSTNTSSSTLTIEGVESAKGTIKITHTGTGSDGSGSGISINLAGTGTAAQGIFIDSTTGTTGNILTLRNNAAAMMALTSIGRLGLGTETPSEVVHIVQTGTNVYSTFRNDAGSVGGYFTANNQFNNVTVGSRTNHEFDFIVNNTVVGGWDTSANFLIGANIKMSSLPTYGYLVVESRATSGQDDNGENTILVIQAPASNPQEATLTLNRPFSAGNREFVDFTNEDYTTDHIMSLNIAKQGTGTLRPFALRWWNQDLGPIDANGVFAFQIDPTHYSTAIGNYTASNFNTDIALQVLSRSAATNAFIIESTAGSPTFAITPAGAVTSGTWNATTVAIAHGGTGQTTANAALNALLPSQTSNSGKFLTTDGTNTSWATVSGSGTVTSVSVVTANGVSGSVATATTTPAITLTLGAITPTSVNSVVLSGSSTPTLAVTGTTTVSGANTGDQTITLTGNVTGSGTGSFAATIASSVALAGSPTTTTQAQNDNSTKIATTAYVDLAVLGQNYKEAAKYGTSGALPSLVYSSGAGTLTGVGFGAITFDGSTPSVNDRVLIKNQVSTFQNGIYVVTVVGTVGTVFVLTRSADANASGEFKNGDLIFVTAGSTLSSTTWAYTGIDSPNFTSDAITYVQVAGQGSFTGGNGITITGTSIAIDTSITVDKTTTQTLTNKTLTSPTFTAPVLGTPASGTMTNVTGVPAAAIVAGTFGSGAYSFGTGNAVTLGTIELGAASDTTLSRSSAGVLAVEGVVVDTISATNTLTNKRITRRVTNTTQSATPTINTDNTDVSHITALAQAITSFTTNLSGTPVAGDTLWINITDNGTARAITWGASFEASTVALPTTTVISTRLDIGFVYNEVTTKWRCIAVA